MKKTQKDGFVLLSVIMFSIILLIIGAATIFMTVMGLNTATSEALFQKASSASDTGISVVALAIKNNSSLCYSGGSVVHNRNIVDNGSNRSSKTFYTVYATKDSSESNCFIYSMGTVEPDGTNNSISTNPLAKVIKTALIPLPDDQLGALTTPGINNLNLNGQNVSFASACGPAISINENENDADQSLIDTLTNNEDKLSGTPPYKFDEMDLYGSIFKQTSDWSDLDDQTTQVVKAKANSLPSECSAIPPSGQEQNANCNTGNQVIVCSGSINKTINLSACPEVAIYAGSININHDVSNSTLTAKATNNFNLEKSAKGFFSSSNVLNINASGGSQTFDGIFIGAGSDNFDISGNVEFNGLYFAGQGGSSSLNISLSGNTKFKGALLSEVVMNNVTRNGGGNNHPNFEYDPDLINAWLLQYPSLFEDFICGDTSLKSSLDQTKISVY